MSRTSKVEAALSRASSLSEEDRARKLAVAIHKRKLNDEREAQSDLGEPGRNGGLMSFIQYFWRVLEPSRPFVSGWVLEGLCQHLEAITRGDVSGNYELTRLLANVSPGSMKSLAVNVFWPAWEWGPIAMPHLRYIAFSYAAHLTERDNAKFRDLIRSREYQRLYGHVFRLTEDGKIKVSNDKTGFKFASSVGGVGTGERADRVLCDDPHHVAKAESEVIREGTVRWFRESMENRLNSLEQSAIVVIMQRVHQDDVSGAILTDGGYCHYMVPMEYDSTRHCTTAIGWSDPRTVDGELAWPERFSAAALSTFRRRPYLWAGQYQQLPAPRGGGIFKESWWQSYEIPPSGAYEIKPIFTVAALDTAFKEKEENDYSALTVWSAYDDQKTGRRCIMLMDAWKKRLPMHGIRTIRVKDEDERIYLRRAAPKWGLVEWVNYTCGKRKIDRLLIEDSARGHDVNSEIQRLYGARTWATHLVPARGDKWSRAHAVVDIFTDEMVHAPGQWLCNAHDKHNCKECPEETFAWRWREWAEMVIQDMAVFPKGTHDDIVDTATMALKHLRTINIAIRREERDLNEEIEAMHKPKLKPLYHV